MNTTTQAPATTIDVPVVSDDEGRRREILLKAAEIIETDGWTHGAAGMKIEGPSCVLGAVARASDSRTYISANHGPAHTMSEPSGILGVDRMLAYRWNDMLRFQLRAISRLRGETEQKIVARTLRKLANGATWEDATR